MGVADICHKAGISQATYFNWKKRYDALLPTEMRRLKQLEDENALGSAAAMVPSTIGTNCVRRPRRLIIIEERCSTDRDDAPVQYGYNK